MFSITLCTVPTYLPTYTIIKYSKSYYTIRNYFDIAIAFSRFGFSITKYTKLTGGRFCA